MAESIVSRKRAWSETNENGEPSTEEEQQNKRQAIIRDEPEQITRGDSTVAHPGNVEAFNWSNYKHRYGKESEGYGKQK